MCVSRSQRTGPLLGMAGRPIGCYRHESIRRDGASGAAWERKGALCRWVLACLGQRSSSPSVPLLPAGKVTGISTPKGCE